MKRALKNGVYGLLALFILLAGALVWLASDEAFLIRQIEGVFLKNTGRQLQIGSLEIDWGAQLGIQARDIHLKNPPWADDNDFAVILELDTNINAYSLLNRKLEIQDLNVAHVTLNLQEDNSGSVNWDFGPPEKSGQVKKKSNEDAPTLVPWESLSISHLQLTHTSPGRNVPLNFRISHFNASQSGSGRVDLDGAGGIGDYPLEIMGFLEPVWALRTGGFMSHQLNIRLGEIQFASLGTVDDANTGAGANFVTRFNGPDFGWILEQAALPMFSSGPFDFEISVDVDDSRSLLLDLDGDLGSLKASADGKLDRLIKPTSLDVDFELDGSDLRNLGDVFGVRNLPESPYQLMGSAALSKNILDIRNFSAVVGEDHLEMTGSVGAWPELSGTALNIAASGADARDWGPAIGLDQTASTPFTLEGRLAEERGSVNIDGIRITLGANSLSIDGLLKPGNDLVGSSVTVRLNIPDLSSLLNPDTLELDLLGPVSLAADIHRDAQGFNIANGMIVSEPHRLDLESMIALLPGAGMPGADSWDTMLDGSDFKARLNTSNADELGRIFGFESIPSESLEAMISGSLDRRGISYQVAGDISGSPGDARFDFEGELQPTPERRISRAEFSLSGPDIAVFYPDESIAGLPGQFHLSGEFHVENGMQNVKGLRFTLGQSSIEVTGTVDDAFKPGSFDLNVTASAPEPIEFASVMNRYSDFPLPPGPVEASFVIKGTSIQFELSDILIAVDASELQGKLNVSLGDVPEYTGLVTADDVDLRWMFDDRDEAEFDEGSTTDKETSAAPAGDRIFGDQPFEIFALDPLVVDVGFSLKSVKLRSTTLSDVELGLRFTENSLRLDPFRMDDSHGRQLKAAISLNETDGRLDASVEGAATGFRLGLMANQTQPVDTIPPWDFYVDLTAAGATPHELFASASGALEFIVAEGQVPNNQARFLFSDILTQLFSALNPFVHDGEYTVVDCGVARVSFAEGRAAIDPLLFQTDKVVISSAGVVNLDTEVIDFGFQTRPRKGLGLSASAIVNPFIRVSGTLSRPGLVLNPSDAAIAGGAALATGGLSIVGQSLYNRFLRGRDPCGEVVMELQRAHDPLQVQE